jgi:DME family drug/metabolite transporter
MLALSAAGVLWGTLGLVVRLLQDAHLPTIDIAFWRLVLATLVLSMAVGRPGFAALRAEARRPWRLLLVGAAFAAFQLAYFVGVLYAGVAVATIITLGVAPVLAVVAESVRARRPPPAATVLTVGTAVAGLVLVSWAGGADPTMAPHPVLGIISSLVSGAAYAGSALLGGRLSRRLGSFVITTATSGIALLIVTPFALVQGPEIPVRPGVIAGLVWLGVVTTALAYGLFYAGLRTTPGSVAMVLTLLEPVTAVVLAVLILGEPATPAGTIGAVLLLGAVAVLYLAPQKTGAQTGAQTDVEAAGTEPVHAPPPA